MQKNYLLVILFLAIGFIAGLLYPRADMQHKEEHVHDHRGDTVQVSEGVDAPELSLAISKDPKSGYNLQLNTKNFTFAPQNASREHKEGEGHAHVYVDGEKVARLYGEWAHLELTEGEHKVEVTLNANDHREYADQYGVPVVVSETIVVEKDEMMDHSSM